MNLETTGLDLGFRVDMRTITVETLNDTLGAAWLEMIYSISYVYISYILYIAILYNFFLSDWRTWCCQLAESTIESVVSEMHRRM